MKKIVLKLDLHDDKAKQKALKTVSTLPGIDSIAMDMKEKKLTVTGIVDPVKVVSKLRKYWPDTTIFLLGLAKEPEKPGEKAEDAAKKEEGAKKAEEGKEEEGQKEGGGEEAKKGGEEAGKKEGEEGKKVEDTAEKKPTPPPDPIMELVKAYKAYNPHLTTYYYVPSMEENPNACTIC